MKQGRNIVVVSQAVLPWPLILVDQGAFCSSRPCVQTVGSGLGNVHAYQALYRLEYGLAATCWIGLISLVWLEAFDLVGVA
jgi:hypothetical protein